MQTLDKTLLFIGLLEARGKNHPYERMNGRRDGRVGRRDLNPDRCKYVVEQGPFSWTLSVDARKYEDCKASEECPQRTAIARPSRRISLFRSPVKLYPGQTEETKEVG